MSLQIQRLSCGEIQENAWRVALEGREDFALVDPGDDYPLLKRAAAGKKLAAILLTHGHFDHILAAGPLQRDTGAPVYVGREDAEMLNDPHLNGLTYLMGIDEMGGPDIEAQPFGETLSVAGLEFEIIPTPGHSKGSVCLYLPAEGALFSGDTLFQAGFGRMDLYGGSPSAMRNSLRRLFDLPDGVRVYPGHGPETTIGAEKRRYRL